MNVDEVVKEMQDVVEKLRTRKPKIALIDAGDIADAIHKLAIYRVTLGEHTARLAGDVDIMEEDLKFLEARKYLDYRATGRSIEDAKMLSRQDIHKDKLVLLEREKQLKILKTFAETTREVMSTGQSKIGWKKSEKFDAERGNLDNPMV